MLKVLIVDDQDAVRMALRVMFEVHGLPVLDTDNPDDALHLIATEDIGVVIQDMNYGQEHTSGEQGIALFRAIHQLDPDLPVLLMTAWASLETAVQLAKDGAADYIAKPWDDEKLLRNVQNLLRLRQLHQENTRILSQQARARASLASSFDLCGLVYQSPAMHQVVALAVHVAPSDAPVLVTGPAGSGKEKLAEIVQSNSRRKQKPFVKVNAGGLPDDLLEAELFGAEAGAFTGAQKLRIGRFEAAHGGTLFLDEIGNLSLSGQARLLRVLQTGEFERLGSSATRKVDVRIVSATNADLQRAIVHAPRLADLRQPNRARARPGARRGDAERKRQRGAVASHARLRATGRAAGRSRARTRADRRSPAARLRRRLQSRRRARHEPPSALPPHGTPRHRARTQTQAVGRM